MSYTWYILNADGSYSATPNGIAVEMLHSMRGEMLEATVVDSRCEDSENCAIAVKDGEEYAVLMVNTSCESVPGLYELAGLEDGEYLVDTYLCDIFENNVVYKRGLGDGTLKVIKSRSVKCENGCLFVRETFDRDSFALLRIRKI
jgi:hypothetical protein